ncbi:hypothetical protein SERLA73DRAFT_182545 [Serpula lacrymans var. lacrymans S7.3]|uniref:NAD(P)-binding protein n=2 Tax=Serpula lacrymans var. lacrymans TaxID=341189 RepID=F8Q0G7_SERL3|nr:uncharacterized protein SERLADRAFT_469255 [Serpula lacrymans var. lacrymans S7.9]EGN97796.1 hypothetical protein SERLA73DRAFT_182545 [Serpula lacrymans var. lacrymans S7.3]EGO23389.1 hypothetical protein SERLADRAFT_469255 [Serpula lacrymans var. lacrymans S7.9]
MRKPIWQFIFDQWSTVPPVEKANLRGKTVVVIGANVGIGLEATKHFARMNPSRLILGCRSETKGREAIEEVKRETKYGESELWPIDLADFSSVKAFADRFNKKKQGKGLDILVMNAGILQLNYEEAKDGWESTIQVNHLSTALLSLLLMPNMISAGTLSSPSRVVIVSSDVHYWATIEDEVRNSPKVLAKLSDKTYCTTNAMRRRYHQTKLFNLFFVRAMAAHLRLKTPMAAVAVNPGYCYSQLRRFHYSRPMLNMFVRMMELLLAWTSEQGARQLVYAAVGARKKGGSGCEEELKGGYVHLAEVVEPSDFVISKEGGMLQEKIWNETIEILSGVTPKIGDIVAEYFQ